MSDDARPQDIKGGVATVGAAMAAPTGKPPDSVGMAAGAAVGAIGTVWNNGKTVTSLWSINQDRNSWMGIAGVGWVKLSNASDTGIMALTALASHAKQLGTSINYRTESDGMAHEIYAW